MTSQSLRMHNRHLSAFNVENLGLIDRLLRFGAGAVLIGQILLRPDNPAAQSYLVLLGLYPAFTALIGWDPLYALTDGRTCGRSPHSVCGSLTDQLRAAVHGWRHAAFSKVLPFRPRAAADTGTESPGDPGRHDRAA